MDEKHKTIIWDILSFCPVTILFVIVLSYDYSWYYTGLKCLQPSFCEIFVISSFIMVALFLLVLVMALALFFIKIFRITYHLFKKKHNKSLKSLVHISIVVLILIACIYSGKTNNPFHISFMRGFNDCIKNKSFDIDEINVWLDSVDLQNLSPHVSSTEARKPSFPKELNNLPSLIFFGETATNKGYVKLSYRVGNLDYGFVFGVNSEEIINRIDKENRVDLNKHRVDLRMDGYIWVEMD